MTLNRILIPTVIIAALSLAAVAPADAAQRHSRASRGSRVYRGGGIRVAPRGFVGARFSRPYYSFRPRFSVGFGLWAGYPVTYPYYDGYPYASVYPSAPYAYAFPPAPYNYPAVNQPYQYPAPAYQSPNSPSPSYPPANYPPANSPSPSYPAQPPARGSIDVEPGGQEFDAGLSFEITPSTAAVFADGAYVGTVAMFDPANEPLGLTPGRHHIEIRAAGYKTMTFDTDVTAGQVIPYRGTLQAAP